MITIISKWLQFSLNSYIIKRWELQLTLSSTFADSPTYHERRSYLTYDASETTTIIAVKRRNCHIRPFYTMQLSSRRTYVLAAMGLLPYTSMIRPSFTITTIERLRRQMS